MNGIGKLSVSLRYSNNYSRKKFYNTGSWLAPFHQTLRSISKLDRFCLTKSKACRNELTYGTSWSPVSRVTRVLTKVLGLPLERVLTKLAPVAATDSLLSFLSETVVMSSYNKRYKTFLGCYLLGC